MTVDHKALLNDGRFPSKTSNEKSLGNLPIISAKEFMKLDGKIEYKDLYKNIEKN